MPLKLNQLSSVPLNIAFTQILNSNQLETNPFESAIREQSIIEQKQIEKQEKLNSFKDTVKQRIKIYKRHEREVNEDAILARHQKRLIHNKQSPIKIIKEIDNINKIDAAKQNLAAKCIEKPLNEPEAVLPGGSWNEDKVENTRPPPKLIKTPEPAKTIKHKRPRSLSPNSLPDFVLRSLLHKTANEIHNTCQQKKRIGDTRKIFSDLEREKLKSDLKSINSIKFKNEKKRSLEEKRIEVSRFVVSRQPVAEKYCTFLNNRTLKSRYRSTFRNSSLKFKLRIRNHPYRIKTEQKL
jgi:hypothetical protein